jgi:predicted molibdopterin-dependent oxidoreductase YjgC
MFQRLTRERELSLTIFIDGTATPARHGDTVAAAMLGSGYVACRTTAVLGAPRGPYCLMGVCFDCLVKIDGDANQQACMTTVRDGMRIETHRGKREYGT